MLPKHARLTKQMIERYLIQARRVKTSGFLVMYTRIPGEKKPYISITVSKKIAPKAVTRNKLRRRGYAACRSLIPKLSPGAALLISYTSRAEATPLSEITEELDAAIGKTGLYR